MSEIVLAGGQVVQVDDADAEWLGRYRWSLTAGYAATRIDGRIEYMHRMILGLRPGEKDEGDHRNRDRLDNRRSNLRVVTAAENRQNTSGRGDTPRGVTHLRKTSGRYMARVKVRGRELYLGCYSTVEEAAAVAADARREHLPFSVEADA
jgi:hypothetical protein